MINANLMTIEDLADYLKDAGRAGLALGQHDQERRHEDQRAERPLPHPCPYRPNRRCRLANSSRASSSCAVPKSGQSVGVKTISA